MGELKQYRKKNTQGMVPWTSETDMSGVSVSGGDIPGAGGMIATNKDDPTDMWYISKKFFEDNYEAV